jgi:hypothetical protein
MDGLPSQDLELKAADERRRLHETVTQLRSTVADILDVRRNVRQHLWELCTATAVISLATGYLVTGLFVRR